MASNDKQMSAVDSGECCSRLGLTNAGLYLDSDGSRYIGITVCENHRNEKLAMKSVKDLQAHSDLAVKVLE